MIGKKKMQNEQQYEYKRFSYLPKSCCISYFDVTLITISTKIKVQNFNF